MKGPPAADAPRPDFLAEMAADARRRVAAARERRPLARPAQAGRSGRLRAALAAATLATPLDGAATPRRLALIAEVKRRSPSRGDLAPALDAATQARAYEAAGVDAVSVLTQPSHFGGSLDDLRAVVAAVRLPVLRKDFIVDRYQVREAADAGAAAVLLIVAMLDDPTLRDLSAECAACGLDVLVEVHDEDDLRRATGAGATLIGINNRDLRTLLGEPRGDGAPGAAGAGRRAARQRERHRLGGGRASRGRCRRERRPGRRGARTRASERVARAREQIARPLRRRGENVTRVKICGLTRAGDVRLAADLGAWACGFVLTDSPRRVAPALAAELATAAGAAMTVGVFTTESADEIAAALSIARLGAAQLSAGADGPSVAAVRSAALARGLRPRIVAAADTPDAGAADYLLADGRSPGRYGGTGRPADWDAAAALEGDRPLVLAGGLDHANVRAAIAHVHPFAVDVAGGVERAPGAKDPVLLAAFFAAAGGADPTGGTFR